MNNTDSVKMTGRELPIRSITIVLVMSYVAAMTILVLSQADVLTGSWVYIGLWLALITALCAFFFGYSLAVTAESRQTRRAQKAAALVTATGRPDTDLSQRPRELVTSGSAPRR